ncbi:MAG: S-adenosylmethionine/S-adenosylhomocysteine transporter [Chlamydiia bacterium]|nr:S-adenosylmethionine/S-adenosylhomocysteine transporter [Chlamydiia bacterium]MCH9616011.1 S-adenosylmethionine/S-adenosylhomocysteine transporter [Chlamydiia bacterium]MCH9629034.1 S-adenosylmethionine/S-adenosylhomocysteine transporter [Chlamydiia bacterium]
MSILIVVFMYGLWSSVFSLGKLALDFSPPVFLTAARMLLAGILITTYMLLVKRKALKVTWKQFGSLAILGFFSIYLTNILEFWGLKHLSAAKVCFIYSLSPFFAALFSYLHFGEKINLRKMIGFGIGFLGFIPVLLMQSGAESLFSAYGFISWPELAIMGAAAASVYGWVLLRVAVKDEISPLTANGISMLIGGTLALGHSFMIDHWAPLPVANGHMMDVAKGILIMTGISNIICYNLYGFMLKKFTATFLSFMGLLSPIFASFTAWFLLGEAPSWVIFMSTGILSSGLFIVYQAELKQGYIQKKKAA